MARVLTGSAIEIARVNRDRFNEAVAAGFYPCAPQTRAGVARTFSEDDILALFVFGRLCAFGLAAKEAGPRACRVLECVQENEREWSIRRAEDPTFEASVSIVEIGEGVYKTWAAESRQMIVALGGRSVDWEIRFPIDFHRKRIRREIAALEPIVGKDD